ncbi:T9SS-dependent choice-of-anchor J family protein [Xanthomarina sp. F2636L]|uniref:T9SS-dependent choice-of-anchor J family protein n=1 Tax=Xanthomarina sp. F2636L TaxID=2996018 RepID=UPI00225DE0F5|nr:choice-of-anchor J domain-containing protein [Xanthomarina sp. F2636L]MCX7551789.1 choice-of-anchor J domain-containing protein [Xanthomarina sp. F2636L]
MKKFTLLITLLLTVNFTFSQVLFEDDFDGSGPGLAGWTLVNVDGLTPASGVSQFTNAWIEADDFDNPGDVVAMSTSWYAPAGTADDWMITPAITLTDAAILTWDEEGQDASFPDGYEVRLSTATTALADFTNVLYTTTAASGAVWTSQSADLTPYLGETVYIAWRNNSTDQFILMINNVMVEAIAAYDVAISTPASSLDQYTQIPLGQITSLGTSATIENLGSDAVTNAEATVTITDGTGTVYTETSIPYNLAVGASQAVTFAGYTPTSDGTYTVTYSVTISETDSVASNNSVATSTVISEITYARDDNTPTGTLGIGADNGGYLGNQYDIIATQDIESVTFSIGNIGGILTGLNVKATVWDMVGGVPNAIIAETDPIVITAVENDMYTATIAGGPFSLTPGQYLVAIEEPDAAAGMPTGENIQVVTTSAIFTTGATWVNWPTNPMGTWANSEDFAFEIAYLIRPNFTAAIVGVEDYSKTISVGLYPNPASNIVTISNPNKVELQTATIIDVTGRIIKTFDLTGTLDSERTLDVSSLGSANYFVTIKSSHGSVTKQLIIK